MSLFQKAEYKEIQLPFHYVNDPDDGDSFISIEAYGSIAGVQKYCFATYGLKKAVMYDNGDYKSMVDQLQDTAGMNLKVKLKYKKDILKDFTLDLDSLAKLYQDERFLMLDLISWGLNDKPWSEIINQNRKKEF